MNKKQIYAVNYYSEGGFNQVILPYAFTHQEDADKVSKMIRQEDAGVVPLTILDNIHEYYELQHQDALANISKKLTPEEYDALRSSITNELQAADRFGAGPW